MVPLDKPWARFALPVLLTFKNLRPEAQDRWDAGERLRFPADEVDADEVLRREVQIFVAESERDRIESFYENRTTDLVELQRSFALTVHAETALDLQAPIEVYRRLDARFSLQVAADLEFLEARLIDPATDESTLEAQEVQIEWTGN